MPLTESCAMLPTASVSGLVLAHPDAHYFAVGRLGRDQVADDAQRKGMPLHEAERWLAANFGYEGEGEGEGCGRGRGDGFGRASTSAPILPGARASRVSGWRRRPSGARG